MQTTNQPSAEPRDIALDRHLAALAATNDRIVERYAAAVRRSRHGSTPEIREAARAEALRLRPSVHPDR